MAEVNAISALQKLRLQSAAGTGTSGIGFATIMQNQISSPSSLEDIFAEMSEKYNVPLNLLKAVAKTESNFESSAVSSCGAAGIMQLMPETAKGLGVEDVYDPYQNIMGGAKYLSGLLKNYKGDVKLALAAYNAGSGNVAKYGGVPPFAETQAYVKRVMEYAGEEIDTSSITAAGASAQSNQLGSYSTQVGEFTYQDYRLFVELFLAQMQTLWNQSITSETNNSSMRFLGW